MEIKLAVTLSLLAGASYLDMIWSSIQIIKRGFDLFPGTVLARDGLAIEIDAVSVQDCEGLSISAFHN